MAGETQVDQRETQILEGAKMILLEEGYTALTMDRLADASECPKGTMYRRFACKEDVVLALAQASLQKRMEMAWRGAAYEGGSRARLFAVGEGSTLFSRLNPDAAKLIHLAAGAVREKASPERVAAMTASERQVGDLIQQIALDGLAAGELRLPEGANLAEVALAFWAMWEGVHTLAENQVPQNVLSLHNPLHRLWRASHLLADTYGWRPCHNECNWLDILADIRRTMFPEEAQRLYGPEQWYGDDA